MRVVVIGAGIGGLTTAAVLARSGLDVTVLEAHVYPGGCASTFFYQGYRFDAGATLAAGFYPGGPMELVGKAAGIDDWPVQQDEMTMQVHLPDGKKVPRRTGDIRWDDIQSAFGQPGLDFFRWQERTADALWALALSLPHWPPQSLSDLSDLTNAGIHWLGQYPTASLMFEAFRPISDHLGKASEQMRLFLDVQLLISAQVTSQKANALYGAAALDLPRRGVVHFNGGIGTLAETLVEAVRRHGGKVHYRHEVTRIHHIERRSYLVETKRNGTFPADVIVANLTPWNIADLMKEGSPGVLRRLPVQPRNGWGAFMLYLGVDGTVIPSDAPLHHQVVLRRPLGEGNSVFISISPTWDKERGPAGQRTLTVSTHTRLDEWWQIHQNDNSAYESRKVYMTEKVLDAVESVIPGIRPALRLVLPGTPVTFQRFTRRKLGWVGGFPQTSLLRAFPPRLCPNLWMVGDSIFPGQSTAAVALGGLRVAQAVMKNIGEEK